MELPSSYNDLVEAFGGAAKISTIMAEGMKSRTVEQQCILQYSIPGLKNGRPLNQVIVMMAGETGTGKSTTINQLFDADLCKTSESCSETSKVTEYITPLTIRTLDPVLKANLIFVDVPGSLDTDSRKESLNVAEIVNYRKQNQALRKPLPKIHRFLSYLSGECRTEVFPNVVLFVFNSSNKRIDGPDSSFKKSLKILQKSNLVDTKFRNLIIVGTHAMSLGKKTFKNKTDVLTHTIQKIVYDVFSIENADVIFVENDPEEYGLKKKPNSDFYLLPDGTPSHENLIEAMSKTFAPDNARQDKLGLLLISWYFRSDCPDKKIRPIVQQSKIRPEDDEVLRSSAEQLLEKLNIKTADPKVVIPFLNFNSLGYAYCPVTEFVKPFSVFENQDKKTLQCGGSKFQIPKVFTEYKEHATNYRMLSSETKSAYEEGLKTQYGMEADVKLIVNVGAQGRWVNETNGGTKSNESIISVLNEVLLYSLKIENFDLVSQKLTESLKALPPKYNEESASDFNNFFSKWGTHFISKQYIGGSIRLDCTVQTSSYNKNTESNIMHKADVIFKLLNVGANYNSESSIKELQSVGILQEKITITGGKPPMVSSMKDMSPEIFKEWKASVEENPKELIHSLVLYPYYNLEQCFNPSEMRLATLDYLKQELSAVMGRKRNEIANIMETKAIAPVEENKCFPASTLVRTQFGNKFISQLRENDQLTTLVQAEKYFHSSSTTFCTYLHKETQRIAKFLAMRFSNGKTLLVTGEHLLLAYAQHNLIPRKACKFQVGDFMVYADESGVIKTPALVEIKVEEHLGVYSPLTADGTFLADGFLVTSYADIESFNIAHAALAPLRGWHRIKNFLNFSKGQEDCNEDQKLGKNSNSTGIHQYARFLMLLRKAAENVY